MDFKKISNEELNLRLEKLARSERKLTHVILLHINEVDSRDLHLKMGYESLFSYLVKALHYSESAAYRRLQAARLLKTNPEVAAKIESGALNLSQLTQMQRCLQAENKKGTAVNSQKVTEVLVSMESKSIFESEKILATEFDLPAKANEITKPQKDDTIRIEFTLTREQFEALKQAQSLLSHQCPDGSWSEVITQLAKKFNQSRMGKGNNNPTTECAETAQGNTATKKPSMAPRTRYRSAITAKTKRYLLAKAHQACEYQDPRTGRRCQANFQLEVDHIKPLALGGEHRTENLRILCRAHNQLAAKKSGLRRFRLAHPH